MKSVLITGTSKGLGYALMENYLAKNYLVYALARDISLSSELRNRYPKTCIPIEADITHDDCTTKIQEAIEAHTKNLDLLINNAGNADILFGLDNVNPSDLDNHFRVHVSGVLRVIKATLSFLQQTESPKIINISSRKGSINKINSGAYRILIPYQVAKAAQNMLTACLNQELKETGIKLYAIHPGNIKTEIAAPDANIEPFDAAEKIVQWINANDNLRTDKFYSVQDNSILNW